MRIRMALLVGLAALVAVGGGVERTAPRVALVAPPAAEGLAMTPETLEAQVKRAGLIVVGQVTEVESRSRAKTIETDVEVEVESSIKGKGPSTLTLTLPGGSVGSTSLDVGGVPRFVTGERVMLILESASKPKLLRLWESKYSLAGGKAHQPGERPSVPIKDLEDQMGRALGKKVSIPQNAEEEVVQTFTQSCPAWPASSLPVEFLVNSANAASSGPTGATFARVTYESWHAWQALGNSYPSFSYGGTTGASGHSIDGTNIVSWDDLDSMGTSVLGVNYCSWSGSNRIDSDTIMDNDRTWDWVDSNGISGMSFRAVMEHELGHGLSLGHSDQSCDGSANTPLMCPAVQSGVRKTILADDQAGAASLYPLSGSPPGAPANVSAVDDGTSFSVDWDAGSGSPLAYDVERGNSDCGGGWVAAGTVDASTTAFVDNDFGAGLTGSHCYRVKALGVGGDSGWAVQVLEGDPQTVSVNPSNATLDADEETSLVATYRHTLSYQELKRNDLIVSTAYNTGLQGCWMFYRRDLNRLYLRSDTGVYLDAGVPGAGTTVENSRCRLLGGSSSVSGTGTDLVVTYRVSFKPAFAGSYNFFLQAEEMGTMQWSGLTDHGDLTLSGPPGQPQTISVAPDDATVDVDDPTSFAATYRHTTSYLQLKRNDLIISTATNTGLQGCWMFYRRDLNRLYLRSDTGAYLNAGAPGTGTTVENSRCRLLGGLSSVSGSGTDLVVRYEVSFKAAFTGTYNLYLQNEDINTGTWSGLTDHGNLTVSGPPGQPETISVTPNDATVDVDDAVDITATYRHTTSYLQLKRNDMIVSTASNTGLQGCWMFYRRDLNRLYLRSDTGAYLDAGAPGSGTTVQNSRCRLLAGSSSVTGSGTDLEVTYSVSFKSGFEDSYNMYLQSQDMNSGQWSGLTDHGDLTVQ